MNEKSNINEQQFYLTHSRFTTPGEYEYLYAGLPSNVEDIFSVVSNLVFSPMDLPDEQKKKTKNSNKELHYLTIREILEKFSTNSKKDFLKRKKSPDQKIAANCRNVSILLCSMLRHKKVPARLRIGFDCYMYPWIFHDKVLVEYWCQKDQKWKFVDGRLNDSNMARLKIKFDRFNVPTDQFFSAATVWIDCIEGRKSDNKFGSGVPGIIQFKNGLWYIRNTMMHDLMMLNKIELTFWYRWGYMLTFTENSNSLRADTQQIAILSQIARTLCSEIPLLDKLQELITLPNIKIESAATSYHPDKMGHQIFI